MAIYSYCQTFLLSNGAGIRREINYTSLLYVLVLEEMKISFFLYLMFFMVMPCLGILKVQELTVAIFTSM